MNREKKSAYILKAQEIPASELLDTVPSRWEMFGKGLFAGGGFLCLKSHITIVNQSLNSLLFHQCISITNIFQHILCSLLIHFKK